jgi:hypothetical protein
MAAFHNGTLTTFWNPPGEGDTLGSRPHAVWRPRSKILPFRNENPVSPALHSAMDGVLTNRCWLLEGGAGGTTTPAVDAETGTLQFYPVPKRLWIGRYVWRLTLVPFEG